MLLKSESLQDVQNVSSKFVIIFLVIVLVQMNIKIISFSLLLPTVSTHNPLSPTPSHVEYNFVTFQVIFLGELNPVDSGFVGIDDVILSKSPCTDNTGKCFFHIF